MGDAVWDQRAVTFFLLVEDLKEASGLKGVVKKKKKKRAQLLEWYK